jgi:hypothetical protein
MLAVQQVLHLVGHLVHSVSRTDFPRDSLHLFAGHASHRRRADQGLGRSRKLLAGPDWDFDFGSNCGLAPS